MKPDDREFNEEEVSTTTTTTKRFEGLDARFGTDPLEIYIELRTGSPRYIRMKEGDLLYEGDAYRREQLGIGTTTLDTWEVTEITPTRVRGRSVETDEEVEWVRGEVENGLATGRYSTNLTDFEWISVYQVGQWDDYQPDEEGSGTRYVGRPYVSVVAYGDNGLKYGRRYRFVEPESNELYLWKEDKPRGGFPDEVAERLDQRVRRALETEGYTVVGRERTEV